MRRALAIAALTAALFVPVAFAGGGAAPPPFPKLAGFTHAEINVRIKKQPHTLILNLGRIVSVDPSDIVLLESDGSTWPISISPGTLITLNGRPALASELHKRLHRGDDANRRRRRGARARGRTPFLAPYVR